MKNKEQIRAFKVFAIKEGTVIDHIPAGQGLKIIQILKLYSSEKIVTAGLNFPSKTLKKKDIMDFAGAWKNISDEEAEKMKEYMQDSEKNAYVLGELQPHRLDTIIEECLMRFQMQEALRSDLKAVSEQLADARDVERAKGVLMKRRQVDEEQALNTLQSMANDRRQRLGDFARSLLAVAEAL